MRLVSQLVEDLDVDFVIPGPGVKRGRLGVGRDVAGAVFFGETHEGGAAGAAVEPDGERGGGGVFAGFEEPEESGGLAWRGGMGRGLNWAPTC